MITPFTDGDCGFGIDEAYRAAARLRWLREQDGDRAVGRKIGLTNRSAWPMLGISAPMWGYVYDSSLMNLSAHDQSFSVDGLVGSPQIEPELVVTLATTPHGAMNEQEVLSCIASVQLGFELVHSIFPGWRFRVPDAVAAGALHGALLVAPDQASAPHPRRDWARWCANMKVELRCNGELISTGSGAAVLGSPLLAMTAAAAVMESGACTAPMRPGEIVTTGSLTVPAPAAGGQRWEVRCADDRLPPLSVDLI